jgi:hypothetical protein
MKGATVLKATSAQDIPIRVALRVSFMMAA